MGNVYALADCVHNRFPPHVVLVPDVGMQASQMADAHDASVIGVAAHRQGSQIGLHRALGLQQAQRVRAPGQEIAHGNNHGGHLVRTIDVQDVDIQRTSLDEDGHRALDVRDDIEAV